MTDDADGQDEARQQSIGEFLRGRPGLRPGDPNDPDASTEENRLRRRLALLGGPEDVAGPALSEARRAGDLPNGTVEALLAVLDLRQLGDPLEGSRSEKEDVSDVYERLRETLGAAADLVDSEWPGTGVVMDADDPDLDAFRTVDERVARFQERARVAEATIRASPFEVDLEELRLRVPPGPEGGRSRSAFRDLVAALLAVWSNREGYVRNEREVREWISGQLAPFFPGRRLDPGSGEPLDNTVKNALR